MDKCKLLIDLPNGLTGVVSSVEMPPHSSPMGAAALALQRFTVRGFHLSTGDRIEVVPAGLEGTVPVLIRDIQHWLRHHEEGQALVEDHSLQSLLG